MRRDIRPEKSWLRRCFVSIHFLSFRNAVAGRQLALDVTEGQVNGSCSPAFWNGATGEAGPPTVALTLDPEPGRLRRVLTRILKHVPKRPKCLPGGFRRQHAAVRARGSGGEGQPADGAAALSAPDGRGAPGPLDTDGLDPKIRVPFSELTLHKIIGKGTFKTVYQGLWSNTHVAVVAMRRGGMVEEARVLQRLSTHPNLVQLYRWAEDRAGNEYLVMELLQLGSLDGVLRAIGRQLLTHTKMTIVEQVCAACLELCREGLVHGDLAARNVLVKSLEPPHVKLADFGLAKTAVSLEGAGQAAQGAAQAQARAAAQPGPVAAPGSAAPAAARAAEPAAHAPAQAQAHRQPLSTAAAVDAASAAEPASPAGTAPAGGAGPPGADALLNGNARVLNPGPCVVAARWAAPEVLAGSPASHAADVWSFGVTVWEIFSNGGEPYPLVANKDIRKSLLQGVRLDRPRGCPNELWQLVQRCWAPDPRRRPGFADIATTLRKWREDYVSDKHRSMSGPPQTMSGRGAGLDAGGNAGGRSGSDGNANTAGGGGFGGAVGGAARISAPAHAMSVAPSMAVAPATGPSVPSRHCFPVQVMGEGTRASYSGVSRQPGSMSTHLSFEVGDPPIQPAYTSGSSIATFSETETHASSTRRILLDAPPARLAAAALAASRYRGHGQHGPGAGGTWGGGGRGGMAMAMGGPGAPYGMVLLRSGSANTAASSSTAMLGYTQSGRWRANANGLQPSHMAAAGPGMSPSWSGRYGGGGAGGADMPGLTRGIGGQSMRQSEASVEDLLHAAALAQASMSASSGRVYDGLIAGSGSLLNAPMGNLQRPFGGAPAPFMRAFSHGRNLPTGHVPGAGAVAMVGMWPGTMPGMGRPSMGGNPGRSRLSSVTGESEDSSLQVQPFITNWVTTLSSEDMPRQLAAGYAQEAARGGRHDLMSPPDSSVMRRVPAAMVAKAATAASGRGASPYIRISELIPPPPGIARAFKADAASHYGRPGQPLYLDPESDTTTSPALANEVTAAHIPAAAQSPTSPTTSTSAGTTAHTSISLTEGLTNPGSLEHWKDNANVCAGSTASDFAHVVVTAAASRAVSTASDTSLPAEPASDAPADGPPNTHVKYVKYLRPGSTAADVRSRPQCGGASESNGVSNRGPLELSTGRGHANGRETSSSSIPSTSAVTGAAVTGVSGELMTPRSPSVAATRLTRIPRLQLSPGSPAVSPREDMGRGSKIPRGPQHVPTRGPVLGPGAANGPGVAPSLVRTSSTTSSARSGSTATSGRTTTGSSASGGSHQPVQGRVRRGSNGSQASGRCTGNATASNSNTNINGSSASIASGNGASGSGTNGGGAMALHSRPSSGILGHAPPPPPPSNPQGAPGAPYLPHVAAMLESSASTFVVLDGRQPADMGLSPSVSMRSSVFSIRSNAGVAFVGVGAPFIKSRSLQRPLAGGSRLNTHSEYPELDGVPPVRGTGLPPGRPNIAGMHEAMRRSKSDRREARTIPEHHEAIMDTREDLASPDIFKEFASNVGSHVGYDEPPSPVLRGSISGVDEYRYLSRAASRNAYVKDITNEQLVQNTVAELAMLSRNGTRDQDTVMPSQSEDDAGTGEADGDAEGLTHEALEAERRAIFDYMTSFHMSQMRQERWEGSRSGTLHS